MRLHQLTMTAFGPYAGTETVDFDELNDAGIFLLTGPTGAGKTSILDAVCFALYGVVPGVREVKTLRSHHAATGVAPEVVLEATIGDRRYRIRRSPEWHRPKKRGAGTTRENACATLVVLEDDGTERLVSSRVAEVGHELTMAVGMSSEQFMQVVLLPQGDFQRFLHATSDERQAVLQKLFHTQRFARIEEWMRDRTRELADGARSAEKRVCQLLATIADRAGTALPDELGDDPLGDVADAARGWADEVVAGARAQHASATAVERAAQEALDRARDDEQRALQLAASVRKRAEARAVLDTLAETEAQATEAQSLLERHAAALQVRPLLQPLDDLRRAADRAASGCDAAMARLPAIPAELRPHPLDRDGCSAAARALGDRLAGLQALLPREAALHRIGLEMQDALGARDDLRDELEELTLRMGELPAEREHVRGLLDATQVVARTLEDARAELDQAAVQHDAALQVPAARTRHELLAGQHLEARERAATARERHLDVVERRLAGMAAELATQLVDGEPCQVCGSAEHPVPAEPGADAVSKHDQQRAADESERQRRSVDQLAEQVTAARSDVERLEAVAGGLSPDEAATRLDSCRRAVDAAEEAVAAVVDLELRVAVLEQQQEDATTRLVQVREQVAAREAEITSLKASFGDAAREVAAAVGAGGRSVEEVMSELQRVLDDVAEAAAALGTHETAQARLQEARAHADGEAARQGFASAAEATEALLDPSSAHSLEQQLRERDHQRRDATAALAEAMVDGLTDDVAAPDVEVTRARTAAATAQWRAAHGVLTSTEQCAASLTALVDQLGAALDRWEPVREQHATAEAMSKLVRGMGSDNQLQMRLSSYVLATRLDQVLDAANERLAHMRDQRYSLRRCATGRGGTRAGLGLEVLDTWTGEARAPSTLSGGETFVVSLALALGLADVVTQEAGGTRVDTLFIDEGFGMLDPETLDDVMDRIDALRAGGRTVGVVSHVTELRGRITTQVHVERGRTGSTVAVRTLVA